MGLDILINDLYGTNSLGPLCSYDVAVRSAGNRLLLLLGRRINIGRMGQGSLSVSKESELASWEAILQDKIVSGKFSGQKSGNLFGVLVHRVGCHSFARF